jgi:hypothetical protein
VPEAELRDGVPISAGWFIVNGAGVPDEHTPAGEVYAGFGEPRRGRAPDLG